jgi:hypothetical protein
MSAVAKKKATKLGKDRRCKHHHWRVTVYYKDGEAFARVYINLEKSAPVCAAADKVAYRDENTGYAHQLTDDFEP